MRVYCVVEDRTIYGIVRAEDVTEETLQEIRCLASELGYAVKTCGISGVGELLTALRSDAEDEDKLAEELEREEQQPRVVTGGYQVGHEWHPFGCECPRCMK